MNKNKMVYLPMFLKRISFPRQGSADVGGTYERGRAQEFVNIYQK